MKPPSGFLFSQRKSQNSHNAYKPQKLTTQALSGPIPSPRPPFLPVFIFPSSPYTQSLLRAFAQGLYPLLGTFFLLISTWLSSSPFKAFAQTAPPQWSLPWPTYLNCSFPPYYPSITLTLSYSFSLVLYTSPNTINTSLLCLLSPTSSPPLQSEFPWGQKSLDFGLYFHWCNHKTQNNT